MPRYGLIVLLLLLIGILSGCMATPEEQVVQGVSNAHAAFESEPQRANKTAGQKELYVPAGYDFEEASDGLSSLITRGSDSFVLLVNPNEKATSTFFYNLQKADAEQQWVVDETFQQNGRFGFTMVKEIAEDRLELVVGTGGVKLTTVTEESELPRNMDWMMKTVRSIDSDE
ncbi:hypothetical protein A1A1_09966 [Planococcus antarcticus DSM 14505]|uniref:DUF4367 domain-containing protein n=1 Tax=Planococcus antarcticus DSM 14505 TaxID=1185653 RepID=A0A1C7DJ10_9BACL|nr:hypothetical protein [Planococcus antarcticus]ANU11445.1 hypothetical protein BBH88_14635 [Planococcus antarcticus DSM 14505]EIM06604.1 hypothetical protein A1A1_09966 [Planococcus antarcticus DSM 14505]